MSNEELALEDIMEKLDNTCYVCNGKGYHIEASIEADGRTSRVKVSCSCCDGTGEAK